MSTDATPAPPHPPVERLTPDDPRLSFDGITGWSPGGDGADGGLLPLRMPLDRLDTTLSANLARLARTTAGVRFAVRTDAASIELEVENSPGGSPLDVRVDGLLAHRWTGGPGRHRIAFALPAGGARPAEVEVWLPHLSATRIAAVSMAGHLSPPDAVDRPGARWVVYGSSIVHCMYAAGPSETWPALVAAERGWRLRNLGLAGRPTSIRSSRGRSGTHRRT